MMNGDEMTLTEMLSKEVGVNGANPTHVPNSQSLQRQASSQLSVKRINRPASVPSTKKFDDCGVRRLQKVFIYVTYAMLNVNLLVLRWYITYSSLY